MSWASFWNFLGLCDRMIPSPTLYITNKVSFSSSESIKKPNRYIIIKEHKNTTIVISIWWQLKSGKIPYQTLLNMLDPKQQHRPFFCDSGKIYWGVCKSKRGFSCTGTHNNINYHMWTEMLIESNFFVILKKYVGIDKSDRKVKFNTLYNLLIRQGIKNAHSAIIRTES